MTIDARSERLGNTWRPASNPDSRVDPEALVQDLLAREAKHRFWDNQLFVALRSGSLTREDFRYVFSQYQLYSKSFTRFISALMANCENDLFRAERAGDTVMVPRWSIHQTENTGATPMRFLAVTDYNLTDRAHVGDAKAYRENEAANLHRHES